MFASGDGKATLFAVVLSTGTAQCCLRSRASFSSPVFYFFRPLLPMFILCLLVALFHGVSLSATSSCPRSLVK